MTETDDRYLDAFASHLKTLADDALVCAAALDSEALGVPDRLPLASALNYLFKSLDLIDDGIEGLGFLDDAFVLRLSVAEARGDLGEDVGKLGVEAELIREFLGDLAPRFDRFLGGLRDAVVRGRSAMAIVTDESLRAEFIAEVRAWASRYEKPNFSADPMNLVKLRSFLAAKLPAA